MTWERSCEFGALVLEHCWLWSQYHVSASAVWFFLEVGRFVGEIVEFVYVNGFNIVRFGVVSECCGCICTSVVSGC